MKMHATKICKESIAYLKNEKVTYGDIRFYHENLSESFDVTDGVLQEMNLSRGSGYGIRVLIDGAWGFASSEDIDSFKLCAETAIKKAKEAAKLINFRAQLAPKKIFTENYCSPCLIDPFTVSTKEKIERLTFLNNELADPRVAHRHVTVAFYKRGVLFADTEGALIEKSLIDVDGNYHLSGIDCDGMNQKRSYRLYLDPNGTRGYELIKSDHYFNQTKRIKGELLSLLDAPRCQEEICDVILLPEMMALQTHETIGHALELDRRLGYERSYAGGSHIQLKDFGTLSFGSKKLTSYADGTIVNSPGSEGFDDDGVKGEKVTLIEEGLLKGAITSRQMICEANERAGRVIFEKSGGANRAQNYKNLPIERMNNINVAPGQDGTVEDIIRDTKNGMLLETSRSWSIDSNRASFHFATEIGWKIRDGKIIHPVRNATYRGDSLQFWHSLDRVGNESTWQMQQIFNCGKGQPNQVMRLGHAVPVCRFSNVQVGK